jgi:hypothetical protein
VRRPGDADCFEGECDAQAFSHAGLGERAPCLQIEDDGGLVARLRTHSAHHRTGKIERRQPDRRLSFSEKATVELFLKGEILWASPAS